jgi:hypothetical protein
MLLIPWVLRGKAFLKRQVSQRVGLDVAKFPYHAEVVEFLRQEHRKGRELVLVTATERGIAERIAGHTGLFSDVLATDRGANLRGLSKLEALKQRYGNRGLVYMGNAPSDLPIWRHADEAILVHPSSRLLKQASRVANVGHIFQRQRSRRLVSILSVIRTHQWVKNLLLFVPLIPPHKGADLALVAGAGIAFGAFCSVDSTRGM